MASWVCQNQGTDRGQGGVRDGGFVNCVHVGMLVPITVWSLVLTSMHGMEGYGRRQACLAGLERWGSEFDG